MDSLLQLRETSTAQSIHVGKHPSKKNGHCPNSNQIILASEIKTNMVMMTIIIFRSVTRLSPGLPSVGGTDLHQLLVSIMVMINFQSPATYDLETTRNTQ